MRAGDQILLPCINTTTQGQKNAERKNNCAGKKTIAQGKKQLRRLKTIAQGEKIIAQEKNQLRRGKKQLHIEKKNNCARGKKQLHGKKNKTKTIAQGEKNNCAGRKKQLHRKKKQLCMGKKTIAQKRIKQK